MHQGMDAEERQELVRQLCSVMDYQQAQELQRYDGSFLTTAGLSEFVCFEFVFVMTSSQRLITKYI